MPDGPSQASDQEVFERLVSEGMARMRWTRKKAEVQARKFLQRKDKKLPATAILGKLDTLDPPREPAKPKTVVPGAVAKPGSKRRKAEPKPITRGQIAKLPPARRKPKTALERLERAVGPEDGRRGGTMFLQGGSPGLGRRR